MATISTRLTSTGTLLVNGTIDEFTGAPVVDGDLMVWLDAGQTSSYPGTGISWTSLTSYGNVATLYNGPTFNNISGGAIAFDGTNDYVQIQPPANVGASTISTIEMWANFKSTGAKMPFGFTGYDVYLNGGSLAYNTGNSDQFGVNSTTVTSLGIVGNIAHYCFVMYNNVSRLGTTYNNNKIYVNGASQQLSQIAGFQSNSTRTLSGIMTLSSWTGNALTYPLNMDVYSVKVYDRELTVAEVLQNYNALAPRFGLAANTSGTTIQRTTSNTVLAAQFDEVTYNPNGTIINKFNQTETFSTWTATNASIITNNTTSPSGSLTASKLYEDATNAIHRMITTQPFVSGITYTISTYARSAERRNFVIYHEEGATSNRAGVQANLQTGTITNYTTGTGTVNSSFISDVGNGWYRFGFSFTASANATVSISYRLIDNAGNYTYNGDGTSGLYVWGAQFEQGSQATIYQPIAAANTLISSTTASKIDQLSNYYIKGQFDEFTGAPVVDGNLKVWLDAGQAASYPGSGSIWYDLSNNGSNAVLFNAVAYNNSAVAMSFNGGYITIPSGNVANVTTTSAVSISVWLRATTIDSTYRRIVSRDSFPTQNWYIEFNGANPGNVFSYSGTASTGNTPVSANVWYNIAMTATSSNVRLYKNGSLVTYNGLASSFVSNTSAIGIGSDANGGTPFLGNISQVMIYNRELTADEVAQNFNALRNRYGI